MASYKVKRYDPDREYGYVLIATLSFEIRP